MARRGVLTRSLPLLDALVDGLVRRLRVGDLRKREAVDRAWRCTFARRPATRGDCRPGGDELGRGRADEEIAGLDRLQEPLDLGVEPVDRVVAVRIEVRDAGPKVRGVLLVRQLCRHLE